MIGSAMFGANFNLVTRVRLLYVFFEILKNGSLQINSLANYVSATKTTSKIASAL